MVGEEELADLRGAAERVGDLGRILQVVPPREPEDDDDFDQERSCRDDCGGPEERRPACPGSVGPSAQVRDDEEEHDHYRARIDEHLGGSDELGSQQEIEHRK